MTRKDDKGDQPSGGETTWTNTGATRYGRVQHNTWSFGDDMLMPSPNHGIQRLPNDDDDEYSCIVCYWVWYNREEAHSMFFNVFGVYKGIPRWHLLIVAEQYKQTPKKYHQ